MLLGTVSSNLDYSREYTSGLSTIEGQKETHRYPIPPTVLATAMNIPRFCRRSEHHEASVITTAQTAYGGTVSNCARAFATDTEDGRCEYFIREACQPDALYPNVCIIVGKNAEIEASAQLAPKYMTPPR